MLSIKRMIHEFAETRRKEWKHDRRTTVGASEIGQCIRKIWFAKHDAPRDPDYREGWGGAMRGNVIENYFWLPALRASLPEGVRLLYAGDAQKTLVDGCLSATTDGLLVDVPRDALAWYGIPDIQSNCINLDCKSIDPRIPLQEAKEEHKFQVQVQMGMIRRKAGYFPEYSIVSYINASFFDDINEYIVKWNPRVYTAAQARALKIMTAQNALEMAPEGKMSGGRECAYCAWASHCADVTVAGVPAEENGLDKMEAGILKRMRDEALARAEHLEDAKSLHSEGTEQIKQFLRDHKTRRYRGDGWSVSYSVSTGRATLDAEAVENAGIDLRPYYKTGKPSDRLTIR